MSKNFYEELESMGNFHDDFQDQTAPDSSNDSGAKNTPEVDIPKPSNATKIFPDEVPRRDGPGGE